MVQTSRILALLWLCGFAACTQLPTDNGELQRVDMGMPDGGTLESDTRVVREILDSNGIVDSIDKVTRVDEVGGRPRIVELILRGRPVRVLPPVIGELTALRCLKVDSNELRDLPVELGDIMSLEEIHASVGFIQGLPASLGNLAHLRVLNVSRNEIAGGIPRELANAAELTHLDLHGNSITLLPPELVGLTKLVMVDVRNNSICLDGADPLAAWLAGFDTEWHVSQNCP